MVEKIKDRKLYHVTITKPYKQAFVANQVVKIGTSHNPFFAFYEGCRVYPVTQADGSVVNVRAVAFLRQVRDGLINCPTLAQIATEVTQHYVMLGRELIMEEIRRQEFKGEPPSRQYCLYACDTLEEAKYWNGRIGEGGTICEMTCTGVIHRADASLLLGDSEPLSETRERGRAYWRGDISEKPELETLFIGEAAVTGFGL